MRLGALPVCPGHSGRDRGGNVISLLAKALVAVQRIDDWNAQDEARQALALELIDLGRIARANTLAMAVHAEGRDKWMVKYSVRLASAGYYPEALDALLTIVKPETQLEGLSSVLGTGGGVAVLQKAAELFVGPEPDWSVRQVLLQNWPADGGVEAIRFAASIRDPWNLGDAVRILSQRISGCEASLLDMARSIPKPAARANALVHLTSGEPGHDAPIISELLRIAEDEDGFGAVSQMLLRLPAGMNAEVRMVLFRKLSLASDQIKAASIGRLSRKERELWPDLKRICDSISQLEERLIGLSALLETAPKASRLSTSAEAMNVALPLRGARKRAWLVSLAPSLAEPIAEQAWMEAWKIAWEEEGRSVETVASVLESMPPELTEKCITQILEFVAWRDVSRTMLERLIDRLPDGPARMTLLVQTQESAFRWRTQPVRRTLDGIAKIDDGWERAQALTECLRWWVTFEDLTAALDLARAIPNPSAKAHAVCEFLGASNLRIRTMAEDEALKLAVSGHVARSRVMEVLQRTQDRANHDWQIAALDALEAEFTAAANHKSSIDPSLFSRLAKSLPTNDSYRLWMRVLRGLALGPRGELLGSLGALTDWWSREPTHRAIVEDSADAMEKVLTWWP